MTIDIDALETTLAAFRRRGASAGEAQKLFEAAPALLRLARLGAAVIAKERARCTCATRVCGVPCDALVAIVAYDTAYAAALEVS